MFEGGPADRAGVKNEDLLEQIEGVDTRGIPLRGRDRAAARRRGDERDDQGPATEGKGVSDLFNRSRTACPRIAEGRAQAIRWRLEFSPRWTRSDRLS